MRGSPDAAEGSSDEYQACGSQMTLELIGTLSVGAALATLNLAVAAWLRADIRDVRTELYAVRTELKTDIHAVRTELKADIHAVRTELGAKIRELRTDVHGLDQRTSRIEGVIEGLFVGMNGRGRATRRAAGQERGEEEAS